MTDKNNDELSNNDEKLQNPGTSRRLFTKSGLASSAVLMSLVNRPALGNRLECTASILASIDAGSSLHDFDPDDCRFGCDPWFWCKENKSWYAWKRIQELTGVTRYTKFKDVFGCGTRKKLYEVLCSDSNKIQKKAAKESAAAWLNAIIMGTYFNSLTPQEIVSGFCYAYAFWDANSDNKGPLQSWFSEMRAMNQGNCPLNGDPDNLFYTGNI